GECLISEAEEKQHGLREILGNADELIIRSYNENSIISVTICKDDERRHKEHLPITEKLTQVRALLKMGPNLIFCDGDENIEQSSEAFINWINIARLEGEKELIRPSKEFKNAVDKAIEGTNPYLKLKNVFAIFGNFVAQRVILGHKLFNYTEMDHEHYFAIDGIKWTTIDGFKKISRSLQDMMMHIDLLTPKGEIIIRDEFDSWVESCHLNYNNLQPVSYGDLIAIYEIFEEPTRGKIKSILKDHEHNYYLLKALGPNEETNVFKTYYPLSKSVHLQNLELTDMKQEILMTDIVQVDSSIIYYRVGFKNKLKSNDYQLYGSITSIFGEQINEKIIKFKAANVFGFSVLIKNISKETKDSGKMNINWMLVGNPKIVDQINESKNIESPYKLGYKSSNFIVIKTGTLEIASINEKILEIYLPTLPKFPINSVFAYTFKYPFSNNEPSLSACIKFDASIIRLIIKKNFANYNTDEEETSDEELKDDFKCQLYW
ncbi:5430_t:CDS:2, partial [Scutellospora calospora]